MTQDHLTELERVTYRDNFRVLLLSAETRHDQGAVAWDARLFDGGREQAHVAYAGSVPGMTTELAMQLRSMVAKVAAPPHVLVYFGPSAATLVARVVPAGIVKALRLVSLGHAAAKVKLLPSGRPRRSISDAAVEDGVNTHGDAAVRLLWEVLGEAGRRGETWESLMQANRKGHTRLDSPRQGLDVTCVRSVPAVPGTYAIFDRDNRVIYVGKSANLQRRLGEHFLQGRELDAKAATLRDRAVRFEVRPAGSELEALLYEQDWIARNPRGLNTQLRVAEGTSRYLFPVLPVAILCPSHDRSKVEVFVCGTGIRALQVTLDRGSPNRQALSAAVRAAVLHLQIPRRMMSIRDWGETGNEICARYFARYRDRVTWISLGSSGGTSAVVSSIVRGAQLLNALEPSEFRSDS